MLPDGHIEVPPTRLCGFRQFGDDNVFVQVPRRAVGISATECLDSFVRVQVTAAFANARHSDIIANLRYATDQQWLILKGRDVRRFGFEQFKPEILGKEVSSTILNHIQECQTATRRWC